MRIVDYDDSLGDAFARLNREWLEKYFHVEAIDREMLSDPQSTIIDPGGAILYALSGTEILGTVALKFHGDGTYELTKMAVTAQAQGRGGGTLFAVCGASSISCIAWENALPRIAQQLECRADSLQICGICPRTQPKTLGIRASGRLHGVQTQLGPAASDRRFLPGNTVSFGVRATSPQAAPAVDQGRIKNT